MEIEKVNFPETNYYKDKNTKVQIVLHHTVSNPSSAQGDIDHWKSSPSRIATPYIIQGDGLIFECFSDSHWAHHLGVTSAFLKQKGFKDAGSRNVLLNKQSIGIEIDAWGGLIKGDGTTKTINNKQVLTQSGVFYNAYGSAINSNLQVEEVAWRGFKFFQRYTEEQLTALGELLSSLVEVHGVKTTGIVDGNFDVRLDALSSVSGIFSHTSYRSDKSDIYPDQRIVQLIKNL